ncbi:MAG: glycerophosphodiester phosphodiesterase family protein [Candidatus Nanopelagicales bacterium]
MNATPARAHPLVVAHRGSSDMLAEHTLAAYRKAINEGADALECDTRLTADGVLVCVHDRRIDRTSDGRGPVSAKTYAELAERDFSSWKEGGDLDEDQELRAGGLLTLEALIELVLAAPRPIDLSIETKHPVRYGGLVEDKVVDMLRRYDLVNAKPDGPRVRLMSFSEIALRRLREQAPSIQTVLLMDRVPVRARSGWLPSGARIAGPGVHIIRAHPNYVSRVHSAGAAVHVWVVDDPSDIDLCIKLGVDGIITNRPAAVLRRLGRESA